MGGSLLVLADEFPEHNAVRPPGGITSAVAFYMEFADVDEVWMKAIAAGAAEHRPPQDTPYGERDGQIIDPFGYRWGLTQHLRDVSHEEKSRVVAAMLS